MGDNDAILGSDRPENFRKRAGNIFVGQAVKSVSSDTLVRDRARQCESRGDLRLGMVKGCVEAGDLRQFRVKLRDGGDGGKIMGLVKRRQGNEVA